MSGIEDSGGSGGGADNTVDTVEDIHPKKVSRPNPSCIIHFTNEDPESNLTCLKDDNSWQTLLQAAQIRNYAPIIDIAKDIPCGQYPILYYHRQCRSRFTLKRDLDAIKNKGSTPQAEYTNTQENVQRKRLARQSPSTSRVMEKCCIFCEKEKYKKQENTREPLVQCSDLRTDKSLRAISIEKQDDKIMTILTRDIVAAEAHYHRSCYKDYIRRALPDSVSCGSDHALACDTIDSDEADYHTVEKLAYRKLFNFIRCEVFSEPKIIPMTTLVARLTEYMEELDVKQIKDSTKKHIRRKLEHEFKNMLHIFPDDAGKLLIMPDNLSRYELAKENRRLTNELEQLKNNTEGNYSSLDKAALCLRSVIKDNKLHQHLHHYHHYLLLYHSCWFLDYGIHIRVIKSSEQPSHL